MLYTILQWRHASVNGNFNIQTLVQANKAEILQLCLTGPLSRESTGNRWIPLTKDQQWEKLFCAITPSWSSIFRYVKIVHTLLIKYFLSFQVGLARLTISHAEIQDVSLRLIAAMATAIVGILVRTKMNAVSENSPQLSETFLKAQLCYVMFIRRV